MNFSSKKLAIVAATLALTAAVLNTPAEARRYTYKASHKPVHKVMRHNATTVTSYRSGDHLNAHLAGAHAVPRSRPAYAGVARGRHAWRYASRHAAPRLSRMARRSYAAVPPSAATPTFGGSGLVAQARQYVGTNPTGMGALWCARFMNMVLEKSGRRGTGSNMANSFANYGSRVSGPQVGAIAVMSRGRRGGHVGIVSGIDRSGNPIVISGNYNRRVAETVISRSRIYAYVMP